MNLAASVAGGRRGGLMESVIRGRFSAFRTHRKELTIHLSRTSPSQELMRPPRLSKPYLWRRVGEKLVGEYRRTLRPSSVHRGEGRGTRGPFREVVLVHQRQDVEDIGAPVEQRALRRGILLTRLCCAGGRIVRYLDRDWEVYEYRE